MDSSTYLQDELGKTRNIRRQVVNKTEGDLLLKKLLADIEHSGPAIIDGAKLTFAGLPQSTGTRSLLSQFTKKKKTACGFASPDFALIRACEGLEPTKTGE